MPRITVDSPSGAPSIKVERSAPPRRHPAATVQQVGPKGAYGTGEGVSRAHAEPLPPSNVLTVRASAPPMTREEIIEVAISGGKLDRTRAEQWLMSAHDFMAVPGSKHPIFVTIGPKFSRVLNHATGVTENAPKGVNQVQTGVFNPATDEVEWRVGDNWFGDFSLPEVGVFNPITAEIEWKSTGIASPTKDRPLRWTGIFDPVQRRVAWKQDNYDCLFQCVDEFTAVFDPARREVQFRYPNLSDPHSSRAPASVSGESRIVTNTGP